MPTSRACFLVTDMPIGTIGSVDSRNVCHKILLLYYIHKANKYVPRISTSTVALWITGESPGNIVKVETHWKE